MTIWDKLGKAFERYKETGESPIVYLDNDDAVKDTEPDLRGIAINTGLIAAIVALGYFAYKGIKGNRSRKGKK